MHGWILDFPSEFFLFEQPIGSLIDHASWQHFPDKLRFIDNNKLS